MMAKGTGWTGARGWMQARRKRVVSRWARGCWALLGWLAWTHALGAHPIGAVATVHPEATRAGLEAMKAGGNAVDAVVAAALMLGVVDGHNSGLGGGCFLLVRLADGRVMAIDGREAAPASATRDLYVREGKVDGRLSQHGVLATGVPGEFAALTWAATNHGRLPVSWALERAARVAEKGFVPGRSYRGRVQGTHEDLAWAPAGTPEFAEFRRIWAMPKGPGRWVLRQPELAATYRSLAAGGPEAFYAGTLARRAVAFTQARGGLMTETDWSSYRPRLREPVRTTYRGHEVVGFPPPSSGGVHVGQILNILERFDLRSMGEDSPDMVHVVAEAMKRAFADRARWLGDPDHVRVPRGLMDPEYAASLAAGIDRARATEVRGAGEPPGAGVDVFESERWRHTTHVSAVDAEGNWVGCTATVNTSFGSKVVVPGTGLVLNNEMDDFAAAPGVPNYFGLVGSEANAVAGGKRPLSSMSPTVVLKDGRPVLVVGAAGGPTIISQAVLAIVRVVDFGRTPREALAGRRFHHQWRPDEVVLERRWGEGMARALRQRGHRVQWVDGLGATQAVGLAKGGRLEAASDPRVEGLGATW